MLSPWPILDAELLRAFAAFAETKNFTHAAARIGLSQPALFERVRRLQDHVGMPLYTRDGRGMVLTEAGEDVLAFARDALQRTERFARELAGGRTETVTLAAGVGSYLYLLAGAIRAFAREHGDALHVRALGGPAAADAVRMGEVDLAVGVFDVIPRGVVAEPLRTTPLCAALRVEHPLARTATVPLAALARERLILSPNGQRHREVIGRAVAALGTSVERPLEADGWAMMLALARSGLGVGVVNGVCEPPEGVVLRPVPELGTVTYQLLGRRDAPRSEPREGLVRAIRREVRGESVAN